MLLVIPLSSFGCLPLAYLLCVSYCTLGFEFYSRRAMGRSKKYSKKRKNADADDEPEFIGTIDEQTDGQMPEETQEADTQPQEQQPDKDSQMAEGDTNSAEQVPDGDSQPQHTDPEEVQPVTKKHRGPTKMKDIARDPNSRIRVEFTELGEPCGEGSVKLSSYLGPLVREHVPVLIDDWRKIGEERKTVLWKSVKVFSFHKW